MIPDSSRFSFEGLKQEAYNRRCRMAFVQGQDARERCGVQHTGKEAASLCKRRMLRKRPFRRKKEFRILLCDQDLL